MAVPLSETPFATRLRQARLGKQLTQVAAAEALDVSQSSVAQWESGRSFPSASLAVRIEKLLGIDRRLWKRGSNRKCGVPSASGHACQLSDCRSRETKSASSSMAMPGAKSSPRPSSKTSVARERFTFEAGPWSRATIRARWSISIWSRVKTWSTGANSG